jgi:hypothetical protein
MASGNDRDGEEQTAVPHYLQQWRGLYVRVGNRIVEAPHSDVAVARSYPRFRDKGPIAGGRRITILTENTTYRVDDKIRVVHVAEFIELEQRAYVMGPKPVYGEYVNNKLMTAPVPDGDPLVPTEYSGVTLPSPAVDYNFDITSYRFEEPGLCIIQWRLGYLRSNVLSIEVSI